MRIARSIVTLVTLVALVAGCRHGSEEAARSAQSPGGPGGHAAVRQSLLAADSQLGEAIGRLGPAEGPSAQLADDAAYLHPGAAVVTGRAAVQAFLRSAYPDRATMQRLHNVTGDASSDGEIGYSFGWFEEDGPAPVASAAAAASAAAGAATGGAPASRSGKYLAAWRRDSGAWRLAVFVRIAAPRAPSAPPAEAGILAGEHGVAQPGNREALRAQVLAADQAFAARSVADGYTVAFTSWCAADAVIAGGGDFHWNAAGVAEALAGWTVGETLVWSPLLGRAAASGDLGYTVGTAEHRVTGKPESSFTKYLTIWVRQADGSWRFVLDGGNARPGP